MLASPRLPIWSCASSPATARSRLVSLHSLRIPSSRSSTSLAAAGKRHIPSKGPNNPKGFGSPQKQPTAASAPRQDEPTEMQLEKKDLEKQRQRAKMLPFLDATLQDSWAACALFQAALVDYTNQDTVTLGPRDPASDMVVRAASALALHTASIMGNRARLGQVTSSVAAMLETLVLAHAVLAVWSPVDAVGQRPDVSLQRHHQQMTCDLWHQYQEGPYASSSACPSFALMLQPFLRAWSPAGRDSGSDQVPGRLTAADVSGAVPAISAMLAETASFVHTGVLGVFLIRECMAAVRAGVAHPRSLLPLLHCGQHIAEDVFIDTLVAAGGAPDVNAELLHMVPTASSSAREVDYFLRITCLLLLSPSSGSQPTVVDAELLTAAPAACCLLLLKDASLGAARRVTTVVRALVTSGRTGVAVQVLLSCLAEHASEEAQQDWVTQFATAVLEACSGSALSVSDLPEVATLLEDLLQPAAPDGRPPRWGDALGAAFTAHPHWLLARIAAAEVAGGGASLLGPLTCAALLERPALLTALQAQAGSPVQLSATVQPQQLQLQAQAHMPAPAETQPLLPQPAADVAAVCEYLGRCPAASCMALLSAAAGGGQHSPTGLGLQRLGVQRGLHVPHDLAARLLTAAVAHSAEQARLQLQHRLQCGDLQQTARLLALPALSALVEACLEAGQLEDAITVLECMPDQRQAARRVLQAIDTAATAAPAAASAAATVVCPLAALCACKQGDAALLRMTLHAAEHHSAMGCTDEALLAPVNHLATALTLLFMPPDDFSTSSQSSTTSSARAASRQPRPAHKTPPSPPPELPATVTPSNAAGLALLGRGVGDHLQPSPALLRRMSQPAVEGMCQALREAEQCAAATFVAVHLSDPTACRKQLWSLCQALSSASTSAATPSALAARWAQDSLRLFAAVTVHSAEDGSDVALLVAAAVAVERHAALQEALTTLSGEVAGKCVATLVRGSRSNEAVRWIGFLPPGMAAAAKLAAAGAVQSLPPSLVTADGWQLMMAAHNALTDGDAVTDGDVTLLWDAAAAALMLGTAVPNGALALRCLPSAASPLPGDAPSPAQVALYLRFFQRLGGGVCLPEAGVAEVRPQLAAMLHALVRHHSSSGQAWASTLPGPALQLAIDLCAASGGQGKVVRQLWHQRDHGQAVELGDVLALKMLVVAATARDAPMGAELIEGQLPRTFKKGRRTAHPDAYAAYAALLALGGNTKAAWQELQALPAAAIGSTAEQLQLAAGEALLTAWCPEGGGHPEALQAWQLYEQMLQNAPVSLQHRSAAARSVSSSLPAAQVTTVAVMLSAGRRNLAVRRLVDARLVLDLAALAAAPGSSGSGTPGPGPQLQAVALDMVRWYSQRGQRGAVAAALFVMPADGFGIAAFVRSLDQDPDNVVNVCYRALYGKAAQDDLLPQAAAGASPATQADAAVLQRGQAIVRETAEGWLEAGGGVGDGGRAKASSGPAAGGGVTLNQALERDLKAGFAEEWA